MPVMTLAQAETSLDLWRAALDAVAKKQSYTIGGRSLVYADLAEIRETIDWLESKIIRLGGRGITTRGVIPA